MEATFKEIDKRNTSEKIDKKDGGYTGKGNGAYADKISEPEEDPRDEVVEQILPLLKGYSVSDADLILDDVKRKIRRNTIIA